MSEASLTNALKKHLAKLVVERRPHLWTLKVHGGAYQRAGVPDILLVYRGRAIWIELKAPDGSGRLSPQQAHELRLLTAAGCPTICTHNLGEAKAFIDAALNSIDHSIDAADNSL